MNLNTQPVDLVDQNQAAMKVLDHPGLKEICQEIEFDPTWETQGVDPHLCLKALPVPKSVCTDVRLLWTKGVSALLLSASNKMPECPLLGADPIERAGVLAQIEISRILAQMDRYRDECVVIGLHYLAQGWLGDECLCGAANCQIESKRRKEAILPLLAFGCQKEFEASRRAFFVFTWRSIAHSVWNPLHGRPVLLHVR